MMSAPHTSLSWHDTGNCNRVIFGLTLAWLLIATAGCRQQTGSTTGRADQQSTAQRDERALESIGQQAWYDSATKEFRPPKISPDPDLGLRRTGTVAGPESSTVNPSNSMTPFTFSGETAAMVMLSILAIALLGVLVAVLLFSFRNWLPTPPPSISPVEFNPARVVDLPFDSDNQMQDPLSFAKQLVARGDLDAAMILLYGYMLLALDHRGRIALHRGKTNRMYLHELGDVQLRKMLSAAMLAFEDVFFGRHKLEPNRFYQVWDQLEMFHRRLDAVNTTLQPVEEATVP